MLYHAAHYDRERPVGTYWEATAGPEPAGLQPLAADTACEVAIVGGGYTGLSCAYHLAKGHGVHPPGRPPTARARRGGGGPPLLRGAEGWRRARPRARRRRGHRHRANG